ncbi:hypothetical protein ACHAWF_016687 [Thalassiosira exigua]
MHHPKDYVGINIQCQSDGTFHFVQTALIDQIIADCGLTKAIAIGKLNYLAQTTRPDIMYAVHSCAKYCSDPRKEHGAAVLDIVMYPKFT